MRAILTVLAGLCLLPTVAMAQVAAQKKADPGIGGDWYASVELRHHLNTYFDADGFYDRQDPSVHARIQAGGRFYGGVMDLYGTLGVYKQPMTQQVLQRRPEAALDLQIVKMERFNLLQYNIVQFPVRAESTGAIQDEDQPQEDSNSVVYTFGLNPELRWAPSAPEIGQINLKAGVDGWTRLFSRKQYTGAPGDVSDPDAADRHADDDGFTLSGSGSESDAGEIEDYAPHYQLQAVVGGGIRPSGLAKLSSELTSHYHSRFDPRYQVAESGAVEHEYAADRHSFYRLRLKWDLDERFALTNDFYHFHEGFYAAKREGEERRFRNIARITCRL